MQITPSETVVDELSNRIISDRINISFHLVNNIDESYNFSIVGIERGYCSQIYNSNMKDLSTLPSPIVLIYQNNIINILDKNKNIIVF